MNTTFPMNLYKKDIENIKMILFITSKILNNDEKLKEVEHQSWLTMDIIEDIEDELLKIEKEVRVDYLIERFKNLIQEFLELYKLAKAYKVSWLINDIETFLNNIDNYFNLLIKETMEKLREWLKNLENELSFLQKDLCGGYEEQEVVNEIYDIKDDLKKMKELLDGKYDGEKFALLVKSCKRKFYNIQAIGEEADNRRLERNTKSCLNIISFDIEEYL